MTAATPKSEIIPVADVAWEDRQPGVRAKSLWAHAPTRRRAQLTRLEPGATLPRHRHVGDEPLEGAISMRYTSLTRR